MTTVSDIITQSLKKAGVLGVGQTASAEDMNDAFLDLTDMLSQWQRQRWLIWHLATFSVTSTGATSYTVTTGGNFNVVRPDRIESAFLRQLVTTTPNYVDYPLEILESREDYNRIALKSLATFPRWIFYDAAYPTGLVYPWPIPQASTYQIFISLKQQLTQYTSFGDDLGLPPEYLAAIKWNLAVRLKESYQLPQSAALIELAVLSLNVIRGANAQVARLAMPADLVHNGTYNIFSDQIS